MMTKSILVPALLLMLTVSGCGGEQKSPENKEVPSAAPQALLTGGTGGPQFIAVDSADKMLLSYLTSINYQSNDSDLHSLIFDADSLREYLSDIKIKKVKIMFAHTLEYINNGGQNQHAGYQSGKLTLVIAGYDANGNYVFATQGDQQMVLDHAQPCPSFCPTSGTAANDLLQ